MRNHTRVEAHAVVDERTTPTNQRRGLALLSACLLFILAAGIGAALAISGASQPDHRMLLASQSGVGEETENDAPAASTTTTTPDPDPAGAESVQQPTPDPTTTDPEQPDTTSTQPGPDDRSETSRTQTKAASSEDATPGSCTMTGGRATLSPGIEWGVMSEQDASMTALISCSSTGGRQLDGSLDLLAPFPVLGFKGGMTTGSGTIRWSDGETTTVEGTVEVVPATSDSGYTVSFALSFEGFAAPATATIHVPVQAEFDPVADRVVAITDMNGTFDWVR